MASNELNIDTLRTHLRPIERSDVENIHAFHSLPETDEFNTLGIPENIGVTERVVNLWLAEHEKEMILNHTLVIEPKGESGFIGLFGLKIGNEKYKRAEVWFKIHPSYWNKGYATEVLNAILDHAFNVLKLHRVHAGCAVENLASARVLEKVGMTKEGRMRGVLPLKSGWSDNFEFGILDSDQRRY